MQTHLSLIANLAKTFICKKNSRRLSFSSWVSVLGASFGVASFLVVVTVLHSFQHQMKSLIASINPSVVLFSPSGISGVDAYQKKISSLLKNENTRVSPFIYQESLLSFQHQTSSAYIRAITGSSSSMAPDLERLITPAHALSCLDNEYAIGLDKKIPKVLLGVELAKNLRAKVGDNLTLMHFEGKGSSSLKYQKVFVCGLIHVGLSQYDAKYVLMNYADAVSLFGAPNWASGIEIRLPNPDDALGVAQRLSQETSFQTVAWQQIDKGLFLQISRDSLTIQLIILIVSLVAGFNIVVTLSLTVMDRSKQIALLRCLGAQRSLVLSVFVLSGVLLSVVGALLGTVLGLVLLKAFSHVALGDFQQFYYLEKIPVELNLGLVAIAFSTIVALSFLGSLYPAWRATRVQPLALIKS